MFHMKGISKMFRTEQVETQALRDLTLDIGAREFVAVTWPSGSGKSTLLNIAGLLEEFTTGDYILDGVSVKELDDNARSELRNEKIGFIFQGFNLIPELDLFDNVEVPLRYRGMGRAERRTRVERALELVGLASRSRHVPGELSGGQQQRVAIARAIAGTPKILLADEPTGNLDSEMAREVMVLLENLNKEGTLILLVTHDAEIAARAPRNVHIVDGIASELTRTPIHGANGSVVATVDKAAAPVVAHSGG